MTDKAWENDPAFRGWFHREWAALYRPKPVGWWVKYGKKKPLRGGNYVYTPWRWDVE